MKGRFNAARLLPEQLSADYRFAENFRQSRRACAAERFRGAAIKKAVSMRPLRQRSRASLARELSAPK
jgi:hypothetical protein